MLKFEKFLKLTFLFCFVTFFSFLNAEEEEIYLKAISDQIK